MAEENDENFSTELWPKVRFWTENVGSENKNKPKSKSAEKEGPGKKKRFDVVESTDVDTALSGNSEHIQAKKNGFHWLRCQ